MKKYHTLIYVPYRQQLLELAKLYGVVEIKNYARSHKRLTTSQLELLLIKNRIKLPANRSNQKVIEKQELKERTLTNIYLSICFIIFLGALITSRPYIKNIVNEVKFTYVAQEYKDINQDIKKKNKKQENAKIGKKEELIPEQENTVSLNAETL